MNIKMKKRIRKIIAGICLASAVAVAAIPADNSGVGMAQGEDLNEILSYTEDIIKTRNGDLSAVDAPNLSSSGTPNNSYEIREIDGQWRLLWKYQYFLDTVGGNTNVGIICGYNDSYNVDQLNLSSDIITSYLIVRTSEFDSYVNDVINNLTATLDNSPYSGGSVDFSGTDQNPNITDAITYVKTYFPNEYNNWQSQYDSALTQWKNANSNNPETPTLEDLGMTSLVCRGSSMADEQKRIFYCDHNSLNGVSLSGYTLVEVHNYAGGLEWVTDSTGSTEEIPSDTTVYAVRLNSSSGNTTNLDANNFKYLNSQGVIAIGNEAFANAQKVSEMTVGEGIAFIGDAAFENSYIQHVQFASVDYIGNRVFKDCQYLTSVTLSEKTSIIGKEAFYGCKVLTTITIPAGVKTIGFGAFASCPVLKVVDMSGNHGVSIGEYAFYNCPSLSTVTFAPAEYPTAIGKAAFALAPGTGTSAAMTDFAFPVQLDTYYYNSSTTGTAQTQYTLYDESGDTYTSRLGDYILAGRNNLQNVTMPVDFGSYSEERIPMNTFSSCPDLAVLKFDQNNNRQATFDSCLFKDVMNPQFYVYGPELTTNGKYAFPREATWKATTGVSSYVPYVYTADGRDHYEVGIDPYRYELQIYDDGTAAISSCRFIDPTNPEPVDLTIPGTVANYTVTTLGDGCFDGTRGDNAVKDYIVNLTVADNSIIEIGANVFQDCERLETVQLGNSVRIIGEEAFADNDKLTSVVIGDQIATVADGAFSSCPELECVVWNSPSSYNTLTSIADDAFKTGSGILYFVGDIKSGYEPFEYAMGNHTINDSTSIRICYVMPMAYSSNTYAAGGSSMYASDGMMSYYTASTYSTMALDAGCACDNCDECCIDGNCESCEYCSTEDGSCENCDNCECAVQETPPTSPDPIYPDVDSPNAQNLLPEVALYVIRDDMTGENLLIDYPHYFDLPEDLRAIYEGRSDDPNASLNADQWSMLYSTMYLNLPEEITSIDIKSYLSNDSGNRNRSNWIYISTDSNWLNGINSQRDIYSDDEKTDCHAGLFSGFYKDTEALTAYGESNKETATRGNDWLLSISMPGVTSIPDFAFDSCERLQSVIISDACKEIGAGAFQDCDELTSIGTGNSSKFVFENYILYEALEGGTYELKICLPSRGKDLSSSGIYVNTTNDPLLSKISVLGDYAFTNCDGIISVDLSKTTVRTIPEGTFSGCSRLSSVTLPDTVRTIGDDAFSNVATSIDVTIPSDCNVSASAFDDKNITTIWTYPTCELIIETFGEPDHNKYSNIFTRYLGSVYTITFLNDDYSVFEKIEVESGRDGSYPEKEPTPQLKAHTGYVFDGWYFENENGIRNVTEPRIAVATFAPRTFTITYLNDDGSVYEVISVPEGFNGSYPAVDPTPKLAMHTGYKFSGWSFTNGGGIENVHENRQAVATFSLDGTNSPSANQAGNGSNGNNGNNGNGSNNGNGGNGSNGTTSGNNVSSNGVRYNVVVENGAGGGSYEPGRVVTITAYAAPTGRVFDRWTTSNSDIGFSNAYGASTTFIMPAHDVKVTATYKQQTASGNSASGNNANNNNNNNNNGNHSGNGSSTSGNNANGNNGNRTDVTITTETIDNNHKNLASATVAGSTDNFVVKITDSAAAYAAVEQALRAQYGDLSNVRFVGFDISLYDETGTRKIENTSGLAVTITIPIPDDLVPYAGNNKAAGVVNGVLDPMTVKFTTIDGVPCMQFTATHFSPYTIYVNTNYLVSGVTDETPKTGDGIHPKWFLAAGLACLSVVLFAWKDKKKVIVK